MNNTKKITFFKRLKIAVFNLDEYGVFIEENLSVAIKYMLTIIFFFSIIFSVFSTIRLSNELKKGINYFENEFPDFSFNEYNLKIDELAYGYDDEYKVMFIADTTENLEKSKIEDYRKQTKNIETSFIILNDKVLYRKSEYETEYSYKYLNNVIHLYNASKKDILDDFGTMGGIKALCISFFIVSILTKILESVIEIAAYVLLVSIIGLIVGRMCGIIMRSFVSETLAIYSLTVSVLCSFIYSIVYNFTGFEIKHFEAMYLIIAYIYMIAAILIIKTDLMKQNTELMRIKSTEEQIRDELKQKELEEKEREEKRSNEENGENEDKKENSSKPELKDDNTEPDGSEI